MKKSVINLELAADALINAQNDSEARSAMALLKDANREELTDDERLDINMKAVNTLRFKSFSMAKEHFNAYPDACPGYVSALINVVPVLQRRCAELEALPDLNVSPREFLHLLDELSTCRTHEEVSAFLNKMTENLEAHPEYQKDGYNRLLSAVRCEIIAVYLEKPEEHGWQERYLLSLLGAMEESVHHCYSLNFLYYENGVFQMVSPENLTEESDIDRLARKLELLQEAMGSVHPYFLEGYLSRLADAISKAVVETLEGTDNEDGLPGHLITLMDYLEELDWGAVVSAAASESPAEDSALKNLLNAQAMIHNLCIHKDLEYLENDWAEFLSSAAGCPACAELLNEQAHAAISIRVMTELMMRYSGTLPETTLCLMRLFLALYTSPVTNTLDDDVLKWVIRGEAA